MSHAGEEAGLIAACVHEDGKLFVVVQHMQCEKVLSRHSSMWCLTDCLIVWRAVDVQEALAWIVDGRAVTTVRLTI